VARGDGADQGKDPVADLGGQRDHGGGAYHAFGGYDGVEHALQVRVGAGDHPAEHVAGAGDGVSLEHLGDRGQPLRDAVVAADLPDLERDERGDLVAERGRIHVGSVGGDDAAVTHAVQAGLHGAAGHAEPARGLQHAHPRLGGQQFDERGVQRVDRPRLAGSHTVQRYHDPFRINRQPDQ
jgi:hypothetical protein